MSHSTAESDTARQHFVNYIAFYHIVNVLDEGIIIIAMTVFMVLSS